MSGTTYETADQKIFALVEKVRDEKFEQLAAEGLTIHVTWADRMFKDENGDEGPIEAIYESGHAVMAAIKKTSLRERAKGISDAELTLCRYSWGKLIPAKQEALIHQQLSRIELLRDKDAQVKRDDLDRPKVKILPYDFIVKGMLKSHEEYQEASIETLTVRLFIERTGQLALWSKDILGSVNEVTMEVTQRA